MLVWLLKELNWLLAKWIRLGLPLAEWIVSHAVGRTSHSPAFIIVYFSVGSLPSPFMKSNSEPPWLARKSQSEESMGQVASPLWIFEVWLPFRIHWVCKSWFLAFAIAATHMPLPCWGCVLHGGKLRGKEELKTGWCDTILAHIQFLAFGVLLILFTIFFIL